MAEIAEKSLDTKTPPIRFSEFSSPWENKLLENLSKRGSGHTPNKQQRDYYNGGIKWVSLGDSHRLDNGFIDDTKIKVSQKGIENSSAVLHSPGTVILSRDAGVGKSAVLKHPMAVSQHFITWKTNVNELDNWFLYYKLQILKREFERIAIGSTIKTIGLPYFKKLKITVPPYKEQKKIASFLLAIDNRINLLEKKKAKLEEYKKGVMQKIFSREISFKKNDGAKFPEWTKDTLNNLFKFHKGTGLSKSNLDENGQFECILYGELFTVYKRVITDVVSRTDSNGGIQSESGDLLIPSSTTTSGIDLANVTVLLKKSVRLSGDIIVLRAKSGKQINSTFYSYYLTHFKKKEIAKRAQGITIIHLYSSGIADLKVDIPSLEEQKLIASFLTSIDEKILLIEQKIEGSNQFKKGLLQQMFV